MILARWKTAAYKSSSEPRRLTKIVKEIEVSTSLVTEEDFKPQKAGWKKGSTSGQTWEVDVGIKWISSEHQAVGLLNRKLKSTSWSWQSLLRDYFEEAMRTPSSALPLMANPFVRTAGQLMFAWSLVGIELEVLTSFEKLKLGNKNLEVYQMLVQHVARDNSGLSLAGRKDVTCFLRWIMSVMNNSTVQACHQKAMGSKTMERRVSTVILNV